LSIFVVRRSRGVRVVSRFSVPLTRFHSVITSRLPGVPYRPTPNARRQFQTALVPTPNQCLSAAADSERMARFNSSLMSKPDPLPAPGRRQRGHGRRASVQVVT
jgi:hypothetical protein